MKNTQNKILTDVNQSKNSLMLYLWDYFEIE